MRDIKFRAWIPSSKQMITDGLVIGTTEYGKGSVGIDSRLQEGEALKGLVWTQYTGLKDKNGKEIYVADILANDEVHKGNFRAVVEDLSSGSFRGVTIPGRNHNRPLWNIMNDEGAKYNEVIGNIYENPELLKGGEE